MRRLISTLLLSAAVCPLAVAQAQAPDTTPPVVGLTPVGGTTTQLLGSGMVYKVTTSEEITFTARASMKYKGKTITVTKSQRSETHYGSGVVEYTLPAATKVGMNALRKAKKAVTVTVKLTGKDVAGNAFTKSKTVKFRKG